MTGFLFFLLYIRIVRQFGFPVNIRKIQWCGFLRRGGFFIDFAGNIFKSEFRILGRNRWSQRRRLRDGRGILRIMFLTYLFIQFKLQTDRNMLRDRILDLRRGFRRIRGSIF